MRRLRAFALARHSVLAAAMLALAASGVRAADDAAPTAAMRDALRVYLAAPAAEDEKPLKQALTVFGTNLAAAVEAVRTHPPLSKSPPGTHHGRSFASGGHEWTYSIRLPKGYDGKTTFPVLVLPDHETVSGEDGISTWEQDAAVEQLVLFRPEITRRREDPARFPDPQFFARDQAMARVMADALAHLRLHYAVDPDRVVMTGLSQAGYYTWYYAVTFPDDFAGIVPESAGGPAVRTAVLPLAENLTGLAVRILHGEGDRVTPYADALAMREAIRRAGGKPELITYRDEDWKGTPPPNRHPGPYPLRLANVLAWATAQRRTIPDSFQRVVRYGTQSLQGRFRLTPPPDWKQPYTAHFSVSPKGEIAADRPGASYLVPADALQRKTAVRFRVGSKSVTPKPDLRLLLTSYKALGDRGRLVVAEIPL